MNKKLSVSLSYLLISASILLASDESSDFEAFQLLVRSSDPRVIQEAAKDDHPGSPAQQRERFEKQLTDSALAVMDRAAEFEKSYPKSAQLPQVRDGVKQIVSMAFGYMGMAIPRSRVAEVEACTRELLKTDDADDGLRMVLFRIAESLPPSQERTRLEELSRKTTPGLASSKVQTALRNLDRIGQVLELSFTAVDGHVVSLTALKGKVVVLDFWAPTCGPCVRDFPHLKELYRKYKAQGLEVLGISLDPDERDLKRFLEKDPLPWPVKYDPRDSKDPVAQAFGIEEIPVVWLIDRHGVLRDLKGREDQDRKIETLLQEQ